MAFFEGAPYAKKIILLLRTETYHVWYQIEGLEEGNITTDVTTFLKNERLCNFFSKKLV